MAFTSALTAAHVSRGASRLLYRMGLVAQAEVPLGNGRRADLVALSAAGEVTLIEIKVSMADLMGDAKWPEYLGYCDRYYWAVPPDFPRACFDEPALGAGRAGLIVADAFDAAIVCEPVPAALAPARRRAELLRFARRAGARLLVLGDPELMLEAAL